MAKVSIMYWKEIPAQVKAEDDDREISMPLPGRFQEGIDEISMFDGSYEADVYLEGWEWGPEIEVEGSAEEGPERRLLRESRVDFPRTLSSESVPSTGPKSGIRRPEPWTTGWTKHNTPAKNLCFRISQNSLKTIICSC